MNALFDLRVSRREWREAATLVMQATRAKVLGADVARRRRAVLLAAQAVEAERTGDAAAQSHALEALALAPGLTAAALIAVRHLIAQGRAWKAQDLIEAAWSQMPHRELAEIYAAIRPEDDREARAVRLIGLAKLNSSHRESRVLMAEQFVALRQWDEARTVLTPLAEDFSSARVCNLMALIALGEQDVLTAQLWRSRAARAGRVADWRCVQCSSVAPEWAAVCRQCGAFDSLNWSAPEPTALVQLPRERAAPAQISGPMHAGPPHPSGVIVDATTRSRANMSSVRKDDSATRFLRLPDDPGPGGPSDIFEVDVEEGDTTTTRQKSG
jgi:HemY protein